MTWLSWHKLSEHAAAEAHVAVHAGDLSSAETLFGKAALAESRALEALEPGKVRTAGITAVSAAALWYKARDFKAAEQLALTWLSRGNLPAFAIDELRTLVQAIWTRASMEQAGVTLLPGQVLVSISGGQTVTGGAPLDLVVERVQTVQALFYRTIELLKDLPHRARGGPSSEIQQACRPWLFQASPGSYQFSVAVQQPRQADFFKSGPTAPEVAATFLNILRASSEDPENKLPVLVPSKEYRNTFLKLTRNLAPNGKNLSRVEVRAVDDTRNSAVVLETAARKTMNLALRIDTAAQAAVQTELRGILRAIHLDQDWLEVLVDGQPVHVRGVTSTVDDVIGPMVNRPVVVLSNYTAKGHTFVDVEVDD